MRVSDVRVSVKETRLRQPFITALRQTTEVRSVRVEVETETGFMGRGEAPEVWKVTGESVASIRACLQGPLRDALMTLEDQSVNDLSRRATKAVVANSSAKAALDMALHNAYASSLGIDLVELLGGTKRSIPTVVTVSTQGVAGTVQDALGRVEEGFRHLKLKVAGTVADTLHIVQKVRDAVGPTIVIRLDANQAWTEREAIRAVCALEDAGVDIECIEQPVHARDLAGMAAVRRAITVPLMADESVFTTKDLLEVIRARAADAVNVKLAKAGSIRQASLQLQLAREAGLGTSMGCMMEGPVGVRAALAVALAHDLTLVPDLDAAWWLVTSASERGLRYRDGTIALDDTPSD